MLTLQSIDLRPVPNNLRVPALGWVAILGTLVWASGCGEGANTQADMEPDASGVGDQGVGGGAGVDDDDDVAPTDGGTPVTPDAETGCRPNPDDPSCPEICPEVCDGGDNDCDGEVDEGEDVCLSANGVSVCLGGRCILAECNEGFRDCDGQPSNGCEGDLASIEHCGVCRNACHFDNTLAACVGGQCEPAGCADTYLDCEGDDGLCETFGQTLSDCASCGAACLSLDHAVPTCGPQGCIIDECLGNYGDCNGVASDGCETKLNTADHCGGCGQECFSIGGDANCDGGVCLVESCDEGYGDCDGRGDTACVPLNSEEHCGVCGQSCTVESLQHVVSSACERGACDSVCEPLFGNCDGDPNNGCETGLSTNFHCGGCSVACSPAHSMGRCDGGSCGVGACLTGWADCDGQPGNGCETNTGLPENCGGCGVQCQTDPDPIGCDGEICTGIACPEGRADCDGVDSCDYDLGDDGTCGSCQVRCEFDQNVTAHGTVGCALTNGTPQQMAWACELACDDGFADCDQDYRNGCEVDLTDLNNCGECGAVCTKSNATPTCENRVCEVGTCNLDWGDCDGDDLDCETRLNSANHCGSCGNDCDFPSAEGQCSGSPGSRLCIIQQCVPIEHENCDGNMGTGCEADTRSDPLNCDGCGNDCTAGTQVQDGVCTDSACVYTCAPNYRDCTPAADGCETSMLAVRSCGSCSNDCLSPDEVATALCQPGNGDPFCEITGCSPNFGDCNGNPADGCEEPVDSSELHCGACNGDPGHQPCENLTGVDDSTCNAGLCVINDCTGNLEDCNGVSADGCEWDPDIDGVCCDPNMDADNDGSDDCADECPSDPAKAAQGACGCFVADTDSDGDGVANCIDGCENDIGKTAPGTCGCGTPDDDGDNDGHLDCDESCDADPDKQEPGLCGCGTPDAEHPACLYTRKALTIQGSQVPSAQSDFPVLVRITDDDLKDHADASGRDIYFTDSDGSTLLPFERESYDYATGALVAWVKMDLTGGDQVFYMYYDEDDLSEKSTASAVWDSNFNAVWHLEDVGSVTDSSTGGHTGSNSGAASVAGVMGSAADFNGTSSYVDLPTGALADVTTHVTASLWAYGDAAQQPVNDHLFASVGAGGTYYLIKLNLPWGDGTIIWDANNSTTGGSTDVDHIRKLATEAETEGQWNHYVLTKDTTEGGGMMRIYINGALWHSASGTSEVMDGDAATVFRLGSSDLGTGNYGGFVDEFRVATTEREASWILTEYNNQKPGSNFLMVGAQE